MFLSVILITSLLVRYVQTQEAGCITENEYQTQCVTPFMEWEQGNNFWGNMCNTTGIGERVFKCILDEIRCNHTDTANHRGSFTAIFQPTKFLHCLACETKNQACTYSDACSPAPQLGNVTIAEFLAFCRAMQLYGRCIDSLNTTCPCTLELYPARYNGVVEFAGLWTTFKESCSSVSSADEQCFTEHLEKCEYVSLTGTLDGTIAGNCGFSENSRSCIANVCGESTAEFASNMVNALQCIQHKSVYCPEITDDFGAWRLTIASTTITVSCETRSPYLQGIITRLCSEMAEWDEVILECALRDNFLQNLKETLVISNDTALDPGAVSIAVDNVLQDLNNVTNETVYEPTSDDLRSIIEIEQTIVTLLNDTKPPITDDAAELFLGTISNTLEPKNAAAWKSLNEKHIDVSASTVLSVEDHYVEVLLDSRCGNLASGERIEVSKPNIHVKVDKRQNAAINYPPNPNQSGAIDLSRASISIPRETLINAGLTEQYCFGASYYSTISNFIEDSLVINGSKVEDGQIINSNVISMRLLEESLLSNLDPPIEIKFTSTLTSHQSKPVCVYWDFNAKSVNGKTNGGWSSEGCILVSVKDSGVDGQLDISCSCDHLTNFAVLMSPTDIKSKHTVLLSYISAIGCGISLLGLCITIVLHICVWRIVRSNRTKLLMSLCVSLALALVVFLAGINRVENEIVCTVIAAFIQYLFLVVFASMLLMGIEIFMSVVLFTNWTFRINVLLPLAWVLPAVIVGVSLGVTETVGYGTDRYCWLELRDGLIWTFVGPVLFVILVNLIVIISVSRKLCSTRFFNSRSTQQQMQTTVRSLCVLLPITGVSWIFGVLSVNDETIILSYLFCIFNASQGILIFIFYGVMNKKLKDALRTRKWRKKSVDTFNSDFRKKSKLSDGRQRSIESDPTLKSESDTDVVRHKRNDRRTSHDSTNTSRDYRRHHRKY